MARSGAVVNLLNGGGKDDGIPRSGKVQMDAFIATCRSLLNLFIHFISYILYLNSTFHTRSGKFLSLRQWGLPGAERSCPRALGEFSSMVKTKTLRVISLHSLPMLS